MYIKNNNKNNSKNVRCVNCGEIGHIVKECSAPVTSFGIIAYKVSNFDDPLDTNLQLKEMLELVQPVNLSNKNIKFLMIQRKDTMGYIDFVRGKYPDEPKRKIKKIMTCLNEMTVNEKQNLATQQFDTIWWNLWVNRESRCFKNEYELAKKKYTQLNMQDLLSKSTNSYLFSEVCIPKGRKNIKEQNNTCAMREFHEETGYSKECYDLIENYPVIIEEFTGTDEIEYRHVYYLAKMKDNTHTPNVDTTNLMQAGEVLNLGFFTIDECLALIRPYDIAKKNVMIKVSNDINGIENTDKQNTVVLYNKLTNIYNNGSQYLIDSLI